MILRTAAGPNRPKVRQQEEISLLSVQTLGFFQYRAGRVDAVRCCGDQL